MLCVRCHNIHVRAIWFILPNESMAPCLSASWLLAYSIVLAVLESLCIRRKKFSQESFPFLFRVFVYGDQSTKVFVEDLLQFLPFLFRRSISFSSLNSKLSFLSIHNSFDSFHSSSTGTMSTINPCVLSEVVYNSAISKSYCPINPMPCLCACIMI